MEQKRFLQICLVRRKSGPMIPADMIDNFERLGADFITRRYEIRDGRLRVVVVENATEHEVALAAATRSALEKFSPTYTETWDDGHWYVKTLSHPMNISTLVREWRDGRCAKNAIDMMIRDLIPTNIPRATTVQAEVMEAHDAQEFQDQIETFRLTPQTALATVDVIRWRANWFMFQVFRLWGAKVCWNGLHSGTQSSLPGGVLVVFPSQLHMLQALGRATSQTLAFRVSKKLALGRLPICFLETLLCPDQVDLVKVQRPINP